MAAATIVDPHIADATIAAPAIRRIMESSLPSPTAAQREHAAADLGRRIEGVTGEPVTEHDFERLLPSIRGRSVRADPPRDGTLVEHEVSGDQPAAGVEQPAQHRTRRRKWWVGDDVERSPREPQVGCVGADDHHRAAELGAQSRSPKRVSLDGDDPGTEADERARQGAVAGADVDDEIAAPDPGRGDELFSPARLESVPAPLPSRAA